MVSVESGARGGPALSAALRHDRQIGSEQATGDQRAHEIIAGTVSGGTNTSHTISVGLLETLLTSVPPDAPLSAYEGAVVIDNVLGKDTEEGRRRAFRYLKELYLLTPRALLFRALRDLWPDDAEARPLLAGLCALARDSVFRASAPALLDSAPGDELTSRTLAEAVEARFPDSYKASTLLKIGRNAFSSWEQTGHLEAARPSVKIRRRAVCRPASVAYAFLLGHLEGARGQALFTTFWAQVLDQPQSRLRDLASTASQQGLIDLRDAGGVVQVGFAALLRPFEGELV